MHNTNMLTIINVFEVLRCRSWSHDATNRQQPFLPPLFRQGLSHLTASVIFSTPEPQRDKPSTTQGLYAQLRLGSYSLTIMTDYEKLTVVKLREELVNRGLPKTGLKAALIQRLVEADTHVGGGELADGKPAPEQPLQEVQEDEQEAKEVTAPPQTEVEAQEDKNAERSEDALQHAQAEVAVYKDSGENEEEITVAGLAEGAQQELSTEGQAENAGLQEQKSLDLGSEAATAQGITDQQDTQGEVLPGNVTRSAGSIEPGPGLQLPTPNLTQPEQSQVPDSLPTISTQASISGEEILEDSRKRKRRSQSPPPSSTDTQKRVKTKNARPHVTLPEDQSMPDAEQEENPELGSAQTTEDRANGHSGSEKESQLGETGPSSTIDQVNAENPTSPNGATQFGEGRDSEKSGTTPRPAKSAESPTKLSPSDTRFKSLFNVPSKIDSSILQPSYGDIEDRVASPALHPATTALYIRELMRPLKPETVKDYLTTLATPPDAPVESSIITEFFLDSIRTHCLVGFTNIAAASRVRSGLHDRIWPNERDRRPLFVDFVPEEKLQKWIDVEQNASSGRGQPLKRWEVIYEDEDGEIKAYLQEVGSGSGGLRVAKPAQVEAGQGIQGAPLGPRVRESERAATQPRADNAKGFQALDDIFQSTTAKPKIYYQPVPISVAERRLNKLAALRGGGRSNEMKRYSFEDDIIVDKGPEFGNRGRGGYGSRGGFSGSYRGRGGNYRGDGSRGGESWRDRR